MLAQESRAAMPEPATTIGTTCTNCHDLFATYFTLPLLLDYLFESKTYVQIHETIKRQKERRLANTTHDSCTQICSASPDNDYFCSCGLKKHAAVCDPQAHGGLYVLSAEFLALACQSLSPLSRQAPCAPCEGDETRKIAKFD